MGGAARAERAAAAASGRPDARAVTGAATGRRTWRDALRHAVDLAVAFATLEDADAHPEPAGESEVRPTSARESVDVRHPHRAPLRPQPRPRRPGAVATRTQACTSPVGHRPATPPRRRTRI
jgi:hypothetical protein